MPKKKNDAHFSIIEKQAISKFLKNLKKKCPLLTRLVLFGSKARGDYNLNSDIDLLAVIRNSRSKKIVYGEVASILSQFNVYLSVKAFNEQEFKRLSRLKTPFMENVKREGITLWPKR